VVKSPIIGMTPKAAATGLARRFRIRRLARGLTQSAVAELAGISRDTVKQFELTGRITLRHFLRLVGTVGGLAEIDTLLRTEGPQTLADLESRSATPKRVRGKRHDAGKPRPTLQRHSIKKVQDFGQDRLVKANVAKVR
jgi:transcriptional regulator with XRE-family HTH domain